MKIALSLHGWPWSNEHTCCHHQKSQVWRLQGTHFFPLHLHGGSHPKQVKMGSRMENNSFVVWLGELPFLCCPRERGWLSEKENRLWSERLISLGEGNMAGPLLPAGHVSFRWETANQGSFLRWPDCPQWPIVIPTQSTRHPWLQAKSLRRSDAPPPASEVRNALIMQGDYLPTRSRRGLWQEVVHMGDGPLASESCLQSHTAQCNPLHAKLKFHLTRFT